MSQSQSCKQYGKKKRQFVCPCGKAYLSNPALFTHVKQKHDGKPPGKVEKPKSLYERRGRPSITLKKLKQEQIQKQRQQLQTQQSAEKLENSPESMSNEKFQEIFIYLKEIDRSQDINSSLLNQVQAFHQLYSYIGNTGIRVPETQPFLFAGVRMGEGLGLFLRTIALRTQIPQFNQVFVLIMLLLQYAIDQNNTKQIIHAAPVQFLVQYINPFIDLQLQNIVEDYNLERFWISKRQNVIKVLFCFYHWLISRKYTQYKVAINQQDCFDLNFEQ